MTRTSAAGRDALAGTVAVVTGGSRGIGLAVAEALVAHGARVAITGRTRRDVDAAASRLGAGAIGIEGDVGKAEDAARMIGSAVERFGGLDVLVNNAGVGVFSNVADMSAAQWRSIIDTNLSGVFYCCQAAIPHLRARGGGWIINVSSLAGKNPFVGGAAYCASKAGLNAFSEALMQEVRHDGIRVTYVMPGSVATGFGGRGPDTAEWKIQPEDVGQIVLDLLATPARSLPSRIELRPSQPPRKG